jgi:hypothetical protein
MSSTTYYHYFFFNKVAYIMDNGLTMPKWAKVNGYPSNITFMREDGYSNCDMRPFECKIKELKKWSDQEMLFNKCIDLGQVNQTHPESYVFCVRRKTKKDISLNLAAEEDTIVPYDKDRWWANYKKLPTGFEYMTNDEFKGEKWLYIRVPYGIRTVMSEEFKKWCFERNLYFGGCKDWVGTPEKQRQSGIRDDMLDTLSQREDVVRIRLDK